MSRTDSSSFHSRRRTLLGALGGAALVSAVAGRFARAESNKAWGEFPAWAQSLALPKALQPKQILEVHLTGGLSAWESLYAVDLPAYGKSDSEMYWTFADGPAGIPALLAQCWPQISPQLQYFAQDALGVDVKFGPLIDALRQRPDILSRLRLHVLSHNLFPHGPAQHLLATGIAPGVPGAVALAAAFERRGQETLAAAAAPHAWILGGVPRIDGIDRIGALGSASTPIVALPDADFSYLKLASELAATASPEVLALRQVAASQLQAQLSWPGVGPVRSGASSQLAASIAAGPKLGKLPDLLPASSLQGEPGQVCGLPFQADWTAMRFQAATSLFALGSGVTRYIALEETGFSEAGGMPGGFDLHVDFAQRAVRLYPHVFDRLCQTIAKPGAPMPGQLSLDDTLVVLSTEFGRSPGLQSDTGRNHYPSAYVGAMFGGPIQAAQKGIVGAIDQYASAINALSPADVRCAILYAAGIWPFEVGLFSYEDVTGAVSEADALLKLRTIVLGIPV